MSKKSLFIPNLALREELSVLEAPHFLLAYFGPETTLPLVSLLGAVIGVLLMFWHFLTGLVAKCFRRVFKKADNAVAPAVAQVLPPQESAALQEPVVVADAGMNDAIGLGS
jgi:hypothetical protein